MNSLRLYLSVYTDGKYIETVVFRDLLSLENGWKEQSNSSTFGIIHVGFIRPKIKLADEFRDKLKGNLIASASTKWALPRAYKTTEAPIINIEIDQQITPCYLITNGFGIHIDPDQFQTLEIHQPSDANIEVTENRTLDKNTIVSASQKVLIKAGKPLSKEEIFAHIIQEGLYKFGAKRPIDVLEVELNRNVVGSEYSKSSENPCFGKTVDNKYYYLASTKQEMTGWLKDLETKAPQITAQLSKYGVYDDDSYNKSIEDIPPSLLEITDIYRYKLLKPKTNKFDPRTLLQIIPNQVLDTQIYALNLPLRVENVFKRQGIERPRDIMPYYMSEIMQWENFGKKSADDFCAKLIEVVDNLVDEIDAISTLPSENSLSVSNSNVSEDTTNALGNRGIEKKPLIEHFENSLSRLGDKERRIIEYRTGANGPALTLQAIAEKMDITRERVRQIQKKHVEKIIRAEYWDDCIAIKIGQLLASRKDPLFLEMLELEDEWFKGFIGNYDHLKAIIELFSENEIRVIRINGVNVITRITQEDWDQSVSSLIKSLKDKSEEKRWTRTDIDILLNSHLVDVGAPELVGLLFKEFDDALQFNGEEQNALLVAFGRSAETAVAAVLEQAEAPLHYSEVAQRATELLGKSVDERRAQGALQSQKAKLYGRGIYGLERFNPIPESMCKNIRLVVSKMMYEGPLMRQWHASGILNRLRDKFSSLPDELDVYILNIILEKEEKLTYLNRMVWARADSNQRADDRIDMADAYTRILEENGAPMKGADLREKLKEIRGISDLQQIQPNEKMIQIGPDFWGLVERDGLHGNKITND
jgi:RNA polymerase sigma factor (sigma-70 family)